MGRLARTVRRQLQRTSGGQRFVRLIVGGGIALVAGLWVARLAPEGSPPWLLGLALVLLGIGGLVGGIHSELDY